LQEKEKEIALGNYERRTEDSWDHFQKRKIFLFQGGGGGKTGKSDLTGIVVPVKKGN